MVVAAGVMLQGTSWVAAGAAAALLAWCMLLLMSAGSWVGVVTAGEGAWLSSPALQQALSAAKRLQEAG